jgi:hypothetical protein
MVLVDTSVWIDYLRSDEPILVDLLNQSLVCMHPMIVGELACGNLHNRSELLSLWQNLPQITEASHDEVLRFLDNHQLMGKGIGYVDLHLLGGLFTHARYSIMDPR